MFSDYIRRARIESNLMQKDVAERLYVSEKTVSAWENGHCVPQPSLWPAISDLYGITIMDIFEQTFQESEVVEFPHLVPREEYRKALLTAPFLSEKSIEDILRRHDAGHGYYWDYMLTLTRQEFEVCKYMMEANEDMTIFEAYDAWIQPRNMLVVRRNAQCSS